MTDLQNAEYLRKLYLTQERRKTKTNICRSIPNWNGCDYCDVYGGSGQECWQQSKQHTCCHCEEREVVK